MKLDVISKTITCICVAAAMGAALPACADPSPASSSIEINLDVLTAGSSLTPVEKTAPQKAAPSKEKKAKHSSAHSAEKHTVKKQSHTQETKAGAAPAEKHKDKPTVVKNNHHAPSSTPSKTVGAANHTKASGTQEKPSVDHSSKTASPEPKPALPPELVPAKPATPEIPVVPAPAASAPKAEQPKAPLVDQLSEFVNGSKPEAPTGKELPPKDHTGLPLESVPSLPALPPAPDKSALPQPATKSVPLPVAPPPAPPVSGQVEPPALPVVPPVTAGESLPLAKPEGELPKPPLGNELPTPPLLPTPPAPAPVMDTGHPAEPKPAAALPLPSTIPGAPLPVPPPPMEKTEPVAPKTEALPPQPQPKTAVLPDLAPLPENMKGNLPSLPSGNEKSLLERSSPTPNKAVAELAEKADEAAPDLRLVFNETETDVPPSLQGQLDSLAQKLAKSPKSKVNVIAYAGGKKESGIYPKRVSLARGIAVRNYLTSTKGIDIERVNVRALGNKSEGGANDRVDLFIVNE